MVGKIARDKPYKSKIKVSREVPRKYSLRQRHSCISYNEAILSCVNAVLDDDTGPQECDKSNNTASCDTREGTLNTSGATLNNGVNKDQTIQNPTTSSSNKMERITDKSGIVLGNPLDLTLHTDLEKSLSKNSKMSSVGQGSDSRDGKSDEEVDTTSANMSDDEVDNSSWDSESDSISNSDTTSDTVSDDDEMLLRTGRTPLTHLKSGHVNRLMSICRVCGAGFCRKGDLNAHMNLIHHQTIPNDKDLWNQRIPKLHDTPVKSMPLLKCEDSQQKCENSNTAVHNMPKLQRELDSIPDLSKHSPHIPKQNIETLQNSDAKCETLQHPVKKFETSEDCFHDVSKFKRQVPNIALPKCECSTSPTPNIPLQKCERSTSQTPIIPLQKCEGCTSRTRIIPLQKCGGSTSRTPIIPLQKCEGSTSRTPIIPLLKCEGSTSQTPNIPLLKCEGSTSQTPNIPLLKCEGSTSQTPNITLLKCEGSTSQTPNIPLLKCEGSTSQTPNIPLLKCEGSTSQTPIIPLLKCEGSTSHTPIIPLQKCEGSTSQTPIIPLLECEGSTSQTPIIPLLKCEGSTSQTPNIPLLKCEGSTSQTPIIPLQKCEGSTSHTPIIPLLKCEGSTSQTQNIPLQKCEGSTSQTPIIPLQKCEGSTSQTPIIPLQKCEGSASQTPIIPLQKCEGSASQTPIIPLQKCEGSTIQFPQKYENSLNPVKKISQNCNTVERHGSLLQSKYDFTDNSTDLEPYQQLPKCEASYLSRNTAAQSCAILSESNVHKWNIYNKDITVTNRLQRAAVLSGCSYDQSLRNGNVLQMSDQTSLTSGPFSIHGSSTKLCPSHKENVCGFDKNGNIMNTPSSFKNHCAESIVSSGNGIQRQDPAKTLYAKKQEDKENLCGHESNLQIWMDKSMGSRMNTSTSFTASSSASDAMDTVLSRSSESSVSSLGTSVSKYDDYMVLPGRQNVKLSHRLQKCPTCGKGFSRLSDLVSHSSTHDPESQRSTDCPTNLKAKNSLVQDCCLKNKSKCGRGRPRKNNSQSFSSGNCNLRKKGLPSGRERQGGKCLQIAQKTRKDEHEGSLKQRLRRGRLGMEVDSVSPNKPSNNKVCPLCKRSFNTNGALQAHFRVHTGERPFECKECNKTFSQKGNLKIHMWIHTQERPYKCSTCSSSYNQLNLLLYHQKKHDKELGTKARRQSSSKN